EDLRMDPIRRDAPPGQTPRQIVEEARRPTEIEVSLARHTQLLERLHPQATDRVEVLTLAILRLRLAVADMPSSVGEASEELPRLRGEGMRPPVAGAVQPPDLSRGGLRHQGMEHRQYRCRADPRAEEHHRPVPGLEGEAAPGLAHLEDIAGSYLAVQVVPARP